MKTSDTITKISAALLQAQKAIQFAKKDAKNPHFKNTYADLPAVIDAIKPALNEAGITFIQTGGESAPGTLSLTTRLLHESGEWIEDTATVPLPKNDPQGYGSAMTYARRYSLAAITGLYQDDDDGNAASVSKPAAKPEQAAPAGLSGGELGMAIKNMGESESMEALQGIFAGVWKRGNPQQQARLKAAYDEAKINIESAYVPE